MLYCAVLYNGLMGGCDQADAMRSFSTCHLTTRKWFLAVFFFVLDQTAINAFKLYQQHCATIGVRVPNRYEFLRDLVSELVGIKVEGKQCNKRKSQDQPTKAPPTKRVSLDNLPERRLHEGDHLPVENQGERLRCKACYMLHTLDPARFTKNHGKTSMFCEHYQVPLCLTHYKGWHHHSDLKGWLRTTHNIRTPNPYRGEVPSWPATAKKARKARRPSRPHASESTSASGTTVHPTPNLDNP